MNEYIRHDQIIARIQHFADELCQVILEKESLLMALHDEEQMIKEMKNEIKTYQEIHDLFDKNFGDILFK